jgi:hypothetical protein
VETVGSLKDFQLAAYVQAHDADTQVGIEPDGSSVLARDTGTQEIYGLSVN